MIYCINPECKHRENDDNLTSCQACGTPLLVRNRYRLIRPLRKLDRRLATEIFEVEDIKDNHTRKVLKILKDNEPKLVEKFEEEALTLQWLDRPGIPKVDIDGYFQLTIDEESDPLNCLVMEKIEGEDLEKWSATHGRISQKVAINWLRQILEILGVLHENKFLHRDIKPSNIILRSPLTPLQKAGSPLTPLQKGGIGYSGQLVLIDFGSVREISPTYRVDVRLGSVTTYISSGYTAPEQIEGKALPESDFFAVGRTFVHLVTGLHPVDLPRDGKTGQLIWRDRAPQISSPLADFIDDLMAADPAARPQNIQVMLRNLTVRGLWLRSVWRFINSRQFKLTVYGVLGLVIAGLGIYRLSFPWWEKYYFNLGLDAQKDNNLTQAKKYYDRALYFNEQNDTIYNSLGLICQYQQDYTCAKKNYEKAIKINPYNYTVRYNLGGVCDDWGDLDCAEENYKSVVESHSPVSVRATSDLSRIKILQGNLVAAITLTSQCIEKTNQSQNKVLSACYKNQGWAYWMRGEYDQAEKDLQQAIKLNSKRTDAYCLLGFVQEAKGNAEEAVEQWENCLDSEYVNNDVILWRTVARQRLNHGKKQR
ncbi:tetratricopeptide repeat protein [Planktothricoides raciborskii]|uniref:non-specific serine/threonine protein kinase n=1 Tax=Planktothricoides raciborskii GIHE-MW2 TaxID=2792601 RepID=A0AAU8JJ37_9CYAN